MKIIIIGYYHYSDGIKAAGESLENENIVVDHFPFMEKVEGNWTKELLELIGDYDIILWWYPVHQIPRDNFGLIISYSRENYKHTKHFHFNWDPSYIPIDTEYSFEVNKKKQEIYPLLDLIITVNPLEASTFPNSVYCPPGFRLLITIQKRTLTIPVK